MREPTKRIVTLALNAAKNSPCQKSKRGCVAMTTIDRRQCMLGLGWNGPPLERPCDGSEACRNDCNKRCVHAEQRAIRDASASHEYMPHVTLVHVKLADDGTLATSGGPSCWQCSREVLDCGIDGVWLYHEAGWRFYPADEFHRLTSETCGVH